MKNKPSAPKTLDRHTRILPCSCSHWWQDLRYGKGMRVHNWAVRVEKWRCTVCKREQGRGER